MEEVFISYKRERRKAAEHLAIILRHYGYSVWFDYSLIEGRDFGLQIDRKVREAKAVVVLWCTMAVTSRWVAEEADLAHELGRLVPVKIESCDPPAGFRRLHHVDLSDWDGTPRGHGLDPLLDAVEHKVGRAPVADLRALREYEQTWRRFGALPLRAFALDGPPETATDAPRLRERPGAGTDTFARAPVPALFSLGRMANDPVSRAERDWIRHGLETTSDKALLRVYSQQYEQTAPLWAYRARQREEAVRLEEAAAAERARCEAEEAERLRIEELSRRHEAEWQAARVADTADTVAAYEAFLAAWTGGPYVEEAKRRLADLRAAAAKPPLPLIRTNEFRVLAGLKGQDEERWLAPGKSVRDFPDAPEMVLVPPGKFWMGSKDGEGDADECPRHEVAIGYPLLVGKYPVTFAEWDAAVKAGGVTRKPGDEGWGRGRRPVINVSWDDAQAYAKWLSETTGKTYRLLSEAEWEYCCRAGTETAFSCGETISTDQANYDGNYTFGSGKKGVHRRKTTEVGSFPPNAFGLHDMHGNVREWVEDTWVIEDPWQGWYGELNDYRGASQNGAVSGLAAADGRVLRGGSWSSEPYALRSAYRYGGRLEGRDWSSGLRVARTLHP